MHMMLFDIFNLNRTEGSDSHMKRYISKFHAFCLCFFKQLRRKVKSCCRRCNRAFVFCIHGLVSVLILRIVVAFNIRRKRHLPKFFEPFMKNPFVLEFHNSSAILTVILYNRTKQFIIGKGDRISRLQSLPRSHHSFPCIAFDSLNQQKLNICVRPFLPAVQPCR